MSPTFLLSHFRFQLAGVSLALLGLPLPPVIFRRIRCVAVFSADPDSQESSRRLVWATTVSIYRSSGGVKVSTSSASVEVAL